MKLPYVFDLQAKIFAPLGQSEAHSLKTAEKLAATTNWASWPTD